MRSEKTPLRRFTAEEKAKVDRLYKYMAVVLMREKNVMLARNQYVDQTIWELWEAVKDEPLLLAAWWLWCQTRDMEGLRWPASQFQTERDFAVENAKGSERAFLREFNLQRTGGAA